MTQPLPGQDEERWTIEICPGCRSRVVDEYTYDGPELVCTNHACGLYGLYAENPEPIKVEVIPASTTTELRERIRQLENEAQER